MKKISLLIVLFPLLLKAQENKDSLSTNKKVAAVTNNHGKNILKMNLSSLALNNYHFTFERQLGKHISLSLGYRYMPNANLPYQDQLKSSFDLGSFDIGNFKMGGYAITPELRFYLSKRKDMRGFYIAPYARYTHFDVNTPVTYTTTVVAPPNPPQTVSKTAPFSGNINAFSGGIMFGMQYNLAKQVVLDIWLIGAHYGNSNGDAIATFNPPLSNNPPAPGYDSEQQSLQKAINNINAKPFSITGKVDASGSFATLNASGPWIGLRGLGLNVGFRF